MKSFVEASRLAARLCWKRVKETEDGIIRQGAAEGGRRGTAPCLPLFARKAPEKK